MSLPTASKGDPDGTNTPATSEAKSSFPLRTSAGVTLGALLLIGLKAWLETSKGVSLDDAASVGLLVLAALPWLSTLLTNAKLPGGWEFAFREVVREQKRTKDQVDEHKTQTKKQLDKQQRQIRTLQVAVRGIVTVHEYEKLRGLNQGHEFMVHYSEDMHAELKRLRALDFIRNEGNATLSQMRAEHYNSPHDYDLKRYFGITGDGREYLSIREATEDRET